MNYKWTVINMVVANDPIQTVIGVSWECHGLIDELNLVASGFETLLPNDGNSFIKYANLTENIVVDWVKQSLGNEKVNAIEANLLANYSKRLEIPSPNNLPWE